MNQDRFDPNFRPKTYFEPKRLEKYLLSQVKGDVLRAQVKALLDEGRYDTVRELISEGYGSKECNRAFEHIHPRYMGGAYLPDEEFGEVEIARIAIESTTHDVTCVYARLGEGVINYRVVDEYGGETLQGTPTAQTKQPMTQGELVEFFMQAWPLVEVLEINFENDLDGAMRFFGVSSEFYPGLGGLICSWMLERFPVPDVGEQCPVCKYWGNPHLHDFCDHACAWVRPGHIEGLQEGEPFIEAFRAMAAAVAAAKSDRAGKAILAAEKKRNILRARLIRLAPQGELQALTELASAHRGGEWPSPERAEEDGRGVYVGDRRVLRTLTDKCRAIVEALSVVRA